MERTDCVVAHSWLRWMISSLAPVVSNVESWGISRRTALRTSNQPQIPRLSSVVWFATTPAPVHPRNDFCADHPRDDFRAAVYRNDSRARESRNESRADEPSANVDSRNALCVEGVVFLRDDETFLGVRKDDVTFLDVHKDGETLGTVVVVGPRESQCLDVKLGSGGVAEHNMSEPLVNSPETKRLMEIAIDNGASVRTAYKDVRKRLRIEARRQKELDGGVEPEVVLDSVLDQVEQHSHSGPLKRVLTPAAKAAKHRRARDKKLRDTLCWWIANDKVCPDGDRCNFRHAVTEEKKQTVSGTGVLSPDPSLRQKDPKGSTRDSWNNSWDRYDYRDKGTDVRKSGHDGNRWIHGWNEHYHNENWTDA